MMWISTAVVGLVLCAAGFWTLFRQYRTGTVSRRWLVACLVGWLSFVSYAVVNAARPQVTTGAVTLVWLLPAFIAVVVLAHEYELRQRRRGQER